MLREELAPLEDQPGAMHGLRPSLCRWPQKPPQEVPTARPPFGVWPDTQA